MNGETCPFCGDELVVDVFEAWSDHSFMLETCCEFQRGALALELVENVDERPRSGPRWFREIYANAVGLELRRVFEHDGMVLADHQLKIKPTTLRQASAFVGRHHEHSRPPRGWKFGGAIYNGLTCIGVVIVGRPVSRHIDQRRDTLEVTRLCLDRTLPTELRWNACSLGYGWAASEVRARGFRHVITYTRQDESGVSLRAAGWTPDRLSAGGSWGRRDRPRTSTNTVPKQRWTRQLG